MILKARVTSLIFLLVTTWAFVGCAERKGNWLPPRPILNDETSIGYLNYFSEQGVAVELGRLQPIMDIGQRNLDWIAKINTQRTPDSRIRLWRPERVKGYPIDSPSIYSEDIVLKEHQELLNQLPASIKAVLTSTSPLPVDPTLPDLEFEEWAVKVDRILQTALRWSMLKPYIGQYRMRKREDIRGYYFLKDDPARQAKLASFSAQTPEEQVRIKKNLENMCSNGASARNCAGEISQWIAGNRDLNPLYDRMVPSSKRYWDNLFQVPQFGTRDDVKWVGNVMEVPFLEPARADVKKFLVENIEDEWKWGPWQLRMRFESSGDFPYIEFIPNVTAHVNRLGGNQIVMDANDPIEEIQAKFVIRHEYGHVLGLPDCYVEFYDDDLQAMVNYQIDLSNLMCSRLGKIKEIHHQELFRVYGQ